MSQTNITTIDDLARVAEQRIRPKRQKFTAGVNAPKPNRRFLIGFLKLTIYFLIIRRRTRRDF